MPIRWFTCPSGERVEINDCLTEGGCRMGSRCATPHYLRMAASERPWTGKPSVTQLIQGTNAAFLKITQEYSVAPYDRAFMIHGTKAHSRLEGYADDFSITEVKLDGPETGVFDVLIQEGGRNILVDYKTSGSYKVMIALGWKVIDVPTGEFYKSGKRKGEEKTRKMLKRDHEWIDRDEWELQLNKYRIELELRGYPIDEMRIQCIVRDGNTWMARSRGVLRNVYYFKIRRLDDEVVLAYFKRKREALYTALEAGECRSLCNAKENWGGIRCERYCEVAEFCALGKYLKKEKEKEAILMPIKGFSEVRRPPRLGKIALGEKGISEKTGKEYPKEIDYFRLRPDTPSEKVNQSIIDKFHGLFGEKPKSIEIMLPMSDREKVFPQYLKWYGGGGLRCKGDGETAICMSKDDAKTMKAIDAVDGMPQVECLYKECPNFGPKKCKEVATLNVLIPKLPGLGVWQITTSSFNSITNINSCLDLIEEIASRVGMIPLTLERRPQEIQHESNGKRSKRTHYILHISTDILLADIQRAGMIDATKALLALPEADDTIEEAEYEQVSDVDEIDDIPFSDDSEEAAPDMSQAETESRQLMATLGIEIEDFEKGLCKLEDVAKIEDVDMVGWSKAQKGLEGFYDSAESFAGAINQPITAVIEWVICSAPSWKMASKNMREVLTQEQLGNKEPIDRLWSQFTEWKKRLDEPELDM